MATGKATRTSPTSFNADLGLRREGDLVVLDTGPEHLVAPGLIHFAVLTTVAEVSAAGVVGAPVVPAQVSVNLMKAARPGRLEGRGRLLRKGRTLAVAIGEVRQDDELVAQATVTFAVMG